MTTSRISTGAPPSVNTLTQPLRGLRAVKERLGLELRANREGERVEGPCAVLWIFRLRANADLDNRVKVVQDAAQGVLFGDDSEIVALAAVRGHGEGPDVEVQVFRWPDERGWWQEAIEDATGVQRPVGTGRAGCWPDRCGGP